MTKLLAILASLSLISTDAFMHNPSITETKITLNYKDTPDIEIKPEINDKVHGGGLWWKEMQYQRAAECALDETVECDIDELFALSKDLALHEDECSVEAVTVEDCQSEVSTRYSLQRILNAQQKLKEMEVAQRKLERLTPAWYDDYVSFYHQ